MWLIDQLYIKLELQLSLSVSTDKHQNRIEFENSLDPTLETQPLVLQTSFIENWNGSRLLL